MVFLEAATEVVVLLRATVLVWVFGLTLLVVVAAAAEDEVVAVLFLAAAEDLGEGALTVFWV